jgi:hypothetical protein
MLARPSLIICGTGGRPLAVDAYFSGRRRPQEVSEVNVESAPLLDTRSLGPGLMLPAREPTSSGTHLPVRCSGKERRCLRSVNFYDTAALRLQRSTRRWTWLRLRHWLCPGQEVHGDFMA